MSIKDSTNSQMTLLGLNERFNELCYRLGETSLIFKPSPHPEPAKPRRMMRSPNGRVHEETVYCNTHPCCTPIAEPEPTPAPAAEVPEWCRSGVRVTDEMNARLVFSIGGDCVLANVYVIANTINAGLAAMRNAHAAEIAALKATIRVMKSDHAEELDVAGKATWLQSEKAVELTALLDKANADLAAKDARIAELEEGQNDAAIRIMSTVADLVVNSNLDESTKQCAGAWREVCHALHRVDSGWYGRCKTVEASAVAAIERMAARIKELEAEGAAGGD